jgi:uncharacterized protein (DUF488 family)
MEASGTVVFTVGHSTRPFEELLTLLRAHEVRKVVDVRRFPGSRRNPQYAQEALAKGLLDAGLAYAHRPELGGRRTPRADSPNLGWRNSAFRGYADHMETEEFRRGIRELLSEASTTRLAVLCAEAVPWRCHRNLLADALVVRGARVQHILTPDRADPHLLTSFARSEGDHLVYPIEDGPRSASRTRQTRLLEEAASRRP